MSNYRYLLISTILLLFSIIAYSDSSDITGYGIDCGDSRYILCDDFNDASIDAALWNTVCNAVEGTRLNTSPVCAPGGNWGGGTLYRPFNDSVDWCIELEWISVTPFDFLIDLDLDQDHADGDGICMIFADGGYAGNRIEFEPNRATCSASNVNVWSDYTGDNTFRFCYNSTTNDMNLTYYQNGIYNDSINSTVHANLASKLGINAFTSSANPYSLEYIISWLGSAEDAPQPFALDNCTIYQVHSMNVSYKDEKNLSALKGVDVSGTFEYSSAFVATEYELSELNGNFSMCIPSLALTGLANYTLSYEDATYPLRNYEEIDALFTSSVRELTLYLLHQDDGIYTRFKTVNQFDNPISGVLGTMRRTIGGASTTVEIESTDDSGIATFFVDPNSDYDFTFSKGGYITQTFTLRPTTSEIYTVQMVAAGEELVSGFSRGILYEFLPKVWPLRNNTPYNFTFALNSSYWDVTRCELDIKNTSGDVLHTMVGSFSSATCFANITFDTGTQTRLIAIATVGLNNTNLTYDPQWQVQDISDGNFTLKHFISDISSFSDAGFDNNTRLLLSFIAILLIMGIAAKFGNITNAEGQVMILFFAVLLFSYFGWMTWTNTDFPLAFRPFMQQYVISVVVGLPCIGYLIWRHI